MHIALREMEQYNQAALETKWTQSREVPLTSGQSIVCCGNEKEGANHTFTIFTYTRHKYKRRQMLTNCPPLRKIMSKDFAVI